jgi:putative ABC transport system permease protein
MHTEFGAVRKLVIADIRRRPGRLFLTILSTVAAACVVVWVVSGYDSLVHQFKELSDKYLGRYEFVAVAVGGEERRAPELPQSWVDSLRQDPAVAVVDPVFQTPATIRNKAHPGQGAMSWRFGPPGPDAGGAAANPEQGAAARQFNPMGEGAGSASTAVRTMNAGPASLPTLVGTDATDAPFSLVAGKWIDSKKPERMEAAISKGLADRIGIKLGDEVLVGGQPGEETSLKIVGMVVQQSAVPSATFMVGLPPSRSAATLTRGPALQALYVPWKLAEKITGVSGTIDYAGVVLAKGIKVADFRAQWAERLKQAAPRVEFQAQEDVGAELDQSWTSETIRGQALSATGISLLAALFIIFTTLNMGVDERVRQFAMLRAVALTKVQIAAMIAAESVFLGLIGWGGGVLAGWGLLEIMSRLRPAYFPVGVSLGPWCIALSGICALGGALAASIIPAWRATRVSPLEAMVVRPPVRTARLSWGLTILGLALISIQPLVVFWLPMADKSRYAVSAIVGCPTMGIGFMLLAPLTVAFTGRFFGPIIARLLGVNSRLLATQLTSNLWRAVGTAAALTVGLGLFVATQTWGYSMLGPFMPGDWAPDALVALTPVGVPDAEIDAVRHVKGIKAEQCLPVAVQQVKFADDVTGFHVRESATRQDNCVMIGIDPDKALGGVQPLFNFRFVAGTPREAVEKLHHGRYCLVPDHFQRESGLGIGDKFAVLPPDAPEHPVQYEIAGVVSMDGWHWMSKNLRRGRAAGLMFAPYADVRRDFGINRVTHFWMNLDGTATEDQIKESLQTIAQRNFDGKLASMQRDRGLGGEAFGFGGPRRQRAAGGESAGRSGRRRERPAGREAAGFAGPPRQSGPGGEMGGFGGRRRTMGANVNLQTAESVRKTVNARADGIIWALCQLPLVTLAVASLGVVNTVLSSVRARRWDMGVLRAIGTTRFGLIRMILAEAILVGTVACLLSLGFGVMAGYCGTGITRYVNIRGGMVTPLILPWAKLAVGFGVTLALCTLAAIWPAVSAGRTEPLSLLQAGRAAT